MKFLCVASLLFAGLLFTARAQANADDKYMGIYGLIQQADGLATSGDPGEAAAAFGDAQYQLQQFKKEFPSWNPNIVSFRLEQVADKLADLKSRADMLANAKKAVQAKAPPAAAIKPAVVAPVAAAPQPDVADVTSEVDKLRTQLQVAQAANDIWQAKLKEALAVQPAAIDPRELEKAQEKIRSLSKELDLLKVSSGGTVTPAVAAVAPTVAPKVETQFVTNVVMVFVTNAVPAAPVEVTNLASVFGKNTEPVIVTNYIRVLVPDTNALEMAELDRAAAVKNFNDEHDRAEKLADELAKLRQNPAAATNDDSVLASLRAENESLKAQLATLRAAAPGTNSDETLAAELKLSRALVAALRSQAEVAALEKTALQNKLQELSAATNAGVNVMDYEARIRDLTQERDGLVAKLEQANKQSSSGNSADVTLQISKLNNEVGMLRSQLSVLTAASVAYAPEELALLKSAVPAAANPDAEKKSISEMPAGTAELVASAQSHFAAQQFDAAEADYLKILDRDQNNGIALANLATIELQQGKLDDAEKHITAALAKTPDDAYNLSTLGYLKFRQEKYDDALKALSRAEQIDPNNPEIENYLGVTLSHQGQRKAAETALRRAIQLSPNYAPAHNNLAVIYLSQNPPLAELARWHYQKALDVGQPRNPDLEKMLADKGAPVAQ